MDIKYLLPYAVQLIIAAGGIFIRNGANLQNRLAPVIQSNSATHYSVDLHVIFPPASLATTKQLRSISPKGPF